MEKEPLKTEVTSIAEEEAKTGQKIPVPSEDDLVARASASFTRNRQIFNELFAELSAKAKVRVMNSVLDLPTDGLPVYLKSDTEKKAFAIGQRVVSDRFIITQYHITKQVREQKAAIQAAKEKAASEEKTLDKEPTT